jgi:hypothetical protein
MELVAYHNNSTKATQNASNLLAYLTGHRLGEDTWSGTSEAYVVHWRDTVRKYHELVDPAARISDTMQLTLLQNAVHNVRDLRLVKERAEEERVRNGTNLTYSQYCTLLQSACQQYDSAHTTSKQRRQPPRKVYNHYTADSDEQIFDEDVPEFSIDTSIDVVSAFAAARIQHMEGSRMPFATWNSLPLKDRQVWDQLSDNTDEGDDFKKQHGCLA